MLIAWVLNLTRAETNLTEPVYLMSSVELKVTRDGP